MVGNSKPFSNEQSGRILRVPRRGKSTSNSNQAKHSRDKGTTGVVDEHSAPSTSRFLQPSHSSSVSVESVWLNVPEKQDTFCWICHAEGKKQQKTFECEKCPRLYHVDCLVSRHGVVDGKKCPSCVTVTVDGSGRIPVSSISELRKLLNVAISATLDKWKDFVKLHDHPDYDTDDVTNPVDLSYLSDKLTFEGYKNTASLLEDAKWIYHRFCVICGPKNEFTNNARAMIEELRTELINIEACPQCYLRMSKNEKGFFKELCSERHILVWGKVKGHPYWPAKVLKVINGKASLLFFGKHERATISLGHNSPVCFLLSKDYPFQHKYKVPIALQGLYEEALKELEEHIQKIIEKYGSYTYAPRQTAFDPSLLQESRKARSEPPRKRARVDRRSLPPSNNKPAVLVDLCDSDSDDTNHCPEVAIVENVNAEIYAAQSQVDSQGINDLTIMISSVESIANGTAESSNGTEFQEQLVLTEDLQEFQSSYVYVDSCNNSASCGISGNQQITKDKRSYETPAGISYSSDVLHVVCDADTTSNSPPSSDSAKSTKTGGTEKSFENLLEQVLLIMNALTNDVINEDAFSMETSKLCDQIKLIQANAVNDPNMTEAQWEEKLLKRMKSFWQKKHEKNSLHNLEAIIKEKELVIESLHVALDEQKEKSLLEVNDLKNQIDSNSAVQKRKEEAILEKEEMLLSRAEQIQKLKEEICKKDQMLESKMEEIQKIKQDMLKKDGRMRLEAEEMKRSKCEMSEKIKALRSRMEAIQETQGKVLEMNRTLQVKREEVENLNEEKTRLEKMLQIKAKEVENLNEKTQRLQETLQVKTEVGENLKERTQKLQEMLQIKTEEIKNLKDKTQRLQETLQVNTEERENLSEKTQKLQEMLQVKTEEIGILSEKTQRLQETLQVNTEERENLSKKTQKSQEMLQIKTEEIGILSEKTKRLQDMLQSKTEETQTLQEMLQIKTEETQSLQETLQIKTEETQRLQETLQIKTEETQRLQEMLQIKTEEIQRLQKVLDLVESDKDNLGKVCRKEDVNVLLLELNTVVEMKNEYETARETINQMADTSIETIQCKASQIISRVATLIKQCELAKNALLEKETELKTQLESIRVELDKEKMSTVMMKQTFEEAMQKQKHEFSAEFQSKDELIIKLKRALVLKQKCLSEQRRLKFVLKSTVSKLQNRLKNGAKLCDIANLGKESKKSKFKNKKSQCVLSNQEIQNLKATFVEKVSELDKLLDRECKMKIALAEELKNRKKESESQVSAVKRDVQSFAQTISCVVDNCMNKVQSELMCREDQLKRLKGYLKNQVKAVKKEVWCYACGKKGEFQCCFGIYYCSEMCQVFDFERHKYECVDESKNYLLASSGSSDDAAATTVDPHRCDTITTITTICDANDSSPFFIDNNATTRLPSDSSSQVFLPSPPAKENSPIPCSQNIWQASRNCSVIQSEKPPSIPLLKV